MDNLTPDDIFGLSIFAFFIMAVLTFFYISRKFMTQTGDKVKTGERVTMWMALIGVILVVIYAVMAFVFKIII